MDSRHWTDDAAIDAWLEWLAGSGGRSPRTVEAYGMAIRRLHAYLAEHGTALLDADPTQLEVFTGIYLHKAGVIARSRVPYISAVRGFFAWASHETRRIVRGNPAKDLNHPKGGQPLPRAMTLTNAEKLMWAPDMNTFIGIRDAAMLAMLIGCGPRVSGVVALNEGDLQPLQLGGAARLGARFTEKGGRTRLLPLPKEAEMLLRVYLAHEELQAVDRDIEIKDGKSTRRDRVLFVSVRSTVVPAHEPPASE